MKTAFDLCMTMVINISFRTCSKHQASKGPIKNKSLLQGRVAGGKAMREIRTFPVRDSYDLPGSYLDSP